MSIFDGSADALTYGQALVEVAARAPWPSEAHAIACLRAIQKEHGLTPPDPDTVPVFDPRDQAITDKDRELVTLREELHRRQVAEAEAAKDAELAALKAQLDKGKSKDKAPA